MQSSQDTASEKPTITHGRQSDRRWTRISLLLYAASFLLPVTADQWDVTWGWKAFLATFFGLVIPLGNFIHGFDPRFPQAARDTLICLAICTIWLANPFYCLTLISIRRGWRITAASSGILAIILASIFLPRCHEFLPCPGYFTWWASVLIATLSAFRTTSGSEP